MSPEIAVPLFLAIAQLAEMRWALRRYKKDQAKLILRVDRLEMHSFGGVEV